MALVDGQAGDDAPARFRELQRTGRIGFVTFHPSYTYEDFVEGIRPVMEGGTGSFECRDGVFKRTAIDALFHCLDGQPAKRPDGFENKWKALLRRVNVGELFDPKAPDGTIPYRLLPPSPTQKDGIRAKGPRAKKPTNLSRETIESIYLALEPEALVQAKMTTVGHLHRGRLQPAKAIAHLLKTIDADAPSSGSFGKTPKERAQAVASYVDKTDDGVWCLRSASDCRPLVLVIDEINRAHVSRVFGELITLLEDDKRIGAANELCVTLPVSGERFGVPPNLFVLGTMNTADKSIALLDVALRRRFEFEELAPDFSVCTGLTGEMRRVLEELNLRMEQRKDRDHRIGHAFFCDVDSTAKFNDSFRHRVVPLLQEFFFNDLEGARWVLGESGRESGNGFLRPMAADAGREARNKWRWFTDANDSGFDCLVVLSRNYRPNGETANGASEAVEE